MPQTHDLGPVFVQSIWLQDGSPLFHLAPTFELESPYRESRHSLVVRMPFGRRAAVFGVWRKTDRDEDEALTAAINPFEVQKNSLRPGATALVLDEDGEEQLGVWDMDEDDVDGYTTDVWPELKSMSMDDYRNNRARLRKVFNPVRLGVEHKFSWFKPLNIIGFRTIAMSKLDEPDSIAEPLSTQSFAEWREENDRFLAERDN